MPLPLISQRTQNHPHLHPARLRPLENLEHYGGRTARAEKSLYPGKIRSEKAKIWILTMNWAIMRLVHSLRAASQLSTSFLMMLDIWRKNVHPTRAQNIKEGFQVQRSHLRSRSPSLKAPPILQRSRCFMIIILPRLPLPRRLKSRPLEQSMMSQKIRW